MLERARRVADATALSEDLLPLPAHALVKLDSAETRIVASLGSVLADVAQLVELSVVVRAVAGSSPVVRPS
jgi:hypothetical protein